MYVCIYIICVYRYLLNSLRATLDKRKRCWFASVLGRRAGFERSLLPVAATLVVR